MDFFSYLAAFLLIKRLQKALKFSPLSAKWGTVLSVSLWSCVIIYIIAASGFNSLGKIFLGSFLLLAFVVFADKEPDFKTMHSFIQSHYPLIAIGLLAGLVQLIAPVFYKKND